MTQLMLTVLLQWVSLTAPPGSVSGVDAIQLLCVLHVLARIPFWIARRARASGGGRRGPVTSAARLVFAAVVLRASPRRPPARAACRSAASFRPRIRP